jgi:hypothetical protein
MQSRSVQPHSLDKALEHVRNGGILTVPSYTRWIVIDKKTLGRFEKSGEWLLKEEGDGYRLRQGKGSVYILPGQLLYAHYEVKR